MEEKHKKIISIRNFFIVGKSLGYPLNNVADIIEFINNLDAKTLIKNTNGNIYWPGLGRKSHSLVWLPVVERMINILKVN